MSEQKITKKTLLDEFKKGLSNFEMVPDTKLSDASSELKNDREIMLTAVKCNGSLYEYIGDSLKSDKQIALTALIQRKNILDEFGTLMDWQCELYLNICEKFDKSLWKDREIVTLALELYGSEIIEKEFIDVSLLKDKEFILSLSTLTDAEDYFFPIQDVYNIAHDSVKNDKDFALQILDSNYIPFCCFKNKMLQDKEVFSKIISHITQGDEDGEIEDLFERFPNLSKDKDICLIVVKDHSYINLIFVDPILRTDADIIQGAISNCLMYKFQDLRKDLSIADRERMACDITNNFSDGLEFMEEDPAYWIENQVNHLLENKP